MTTYLKSVSCPMALVLFLIGCGSEEPATDDATIPADTLEVAVDESDSQDSEDDVVKIKYEPVEEKWDLDGHPVSLGGLGFVPASQWTEVDPVGEETVRYSYGPLRDETHPARLSVSFVGQAVGGEYMDWFGRWLARMDYSHLADPNTAAIRHDRQADGMTVHVQSLWGSFIPSENDFNADQPGPRPNHRFLGVVVDAPQGAVLFELVGPDYTARVMIEGFMNMVYRLKKN